MVFDDGKIFQRQMVGAPNAETMMYVLQRTSCPVITANEMTASKKIWKFGPKFFQIAAHMESRQISTNAAYTNTKEAMHEVLRELTKWEIKSIDAYNIEIWEFCTLAIVNGFPRMYLDDIVSYPLYDYARAVFEKEDEFSKSHFEAKLKEMHGDVSVSNEPVQDVSQAILEVFSTDVVPRAYVPPSTVEDNTHPFASNVAIPHVNAKLPSAPNSIFNAGLDNEDTSSMG
jgi:hypothetical protein